MVDPCHMKNEYKIYKKTILKKTNYQKNIVTTMIIKH